MVYQRKWYAVTVGKEPGVYSTWLEAAPKTKHIPGGAIHQSFPSEEEAIRAFEAALARGEVKAYPNAGKEDEATDKSKNAPPSPLGIEASLLGVPLDLKRDIKSAALQAPLSPPARVARLGRILRQPPATDPCSTFSSPPTGVTQAYAPLYMEDDSPPGSPIVRLSPHFMFTSSSSSSYLDISHEHSPEVDTAEVPVQLEVSDWGSHPSAEEHTSKSSRCMPLHPGTPFRSKGVQYRSLTDLAETKSIDSRIWLPRPRIFDPDKIKPRPLTRPPSPAKRGILPVLGQGTVDGSPQLRRQASAVDSPFVRVDRGRRSRLTPSASLPIFPGREFEGDSSDCRLRPIPPSGDHSADRGEEGALHKSRKDDCLAERRPVYCPSPRNDCRSHAQLVPRDGKDERSVIMVYCPPNCLHETCLKPSRYADASISPIITITSRVQRTDSPTKIRSKGSDLDEDSLCELAGFAHVSHQGIAPETDVRSPIAKGTMVPMNAAE